MASKFVPRPSVLEIVLKMNSDLEMITRKDRQQGVHVYRTYPSVVTWHLRDGQSKPLYIP